MKVNTRTIRSTAEAHYVTSMVMSMKEIGLMMSGEVKESYPTQTVPHTRETSRTIKSMDKEPING